LADIAADATGSVQVTGVFQLPKKAADTVAQGALVYWDATNQQITTTASGNTLAGFAAHAAAATTTAVDVKINA
jgi:predicted RecA/RadA family phage recombinase